MLFLVLFMAAPSVSHSTSPTRQQIRAALVYKFAQFVRWPAGAAAKNIPMVVGILGDDAIRADLEKSLEGKSLHGRHLEVRTFRRPEDVRDCGILVVDVLESRQQMILDALPREGLLTIGDGAAFARHGGVIALILEGDQLKFDLNLAAADEAGLSFDATLLGLAREAGRW